MRKPLQGIGITLLLTLAACKDAGDDSVPDDSATPDDSEAPDYEEGCILVDGGGGYAHLADAYTVAGEGSTITLCEGVLELESTFVIDKPVTLEGPGPSALTWNAPVNQALLSIEGASGVVVSGFSLSSTRNGIEVNDASDVTLADITFTTVANTGVKSTDSTGVTLDSLTFVAPAYGGVEVDGGTLTVSASDFQAPVAFAVKALGGAEVTVAGSTVDSVTYTDATEGLVDGFALWAVDGARLITQDNVLTNNVIHVLVEEADMNLSGDQISGGLYGVLSLLGEATLEGVTITDPYYAALRILNQTDTISIVDTQITGTPELVDTGTYNFDSYIGGALTLATDGTATLENVGIQGYNSMGVIVLGYSATPTVEMSQVTITSPGRYGLRMHGAEATLTDVTIDSMRLVDSPDEVNLNGSYDTGFAVSLWECDTTWTGGGVLDSELIGLINYQGALQIEDWSMENAVAFGLWNYYGSAVVTGGYFTGSSESGGIANYYGDLTLQTSVFENNRATYTYEYEYDDGTQVTVYGYEYSDQSMDILCYQGTRCDLLNNTFTDGSSGVQISSTTSALVQGNTWQDYSRQPISLYSNTGEITLEDNVFEDIGYYALYCYSSAFEASGLEVDGVVGSSTTVTYTTNGEPTGSYSYTSSGQALYLYNCQGLIEDLKVSGATYHALYSYDTALELYGAEVEAGSGSGTSSYGTLHATWSTTSPSFIASEVEIDSPTAGHGLSLQGNGLGTADTLWLDEVNITGAASRGIYASALGGLTLDNVRITGSGSHGVYLDGAGEVSFSDVVVDGSGGYGVYVDGRWDYDGDGYSIADGDCDDTQTGRNPGATEDVDSVDDDCDGVADDGTSTADADGDGYAIAEGDCNDTSSSVYPGAFERTYGVDDDCDGVADNQAAAWVDLSGLTATGNSSGGAYLISVDTALSTAVLTSNTGYGLTCSGDVELDTCDAADLSGNSVGEASGCTACED